MAKRYISNKDDVQRLILRVETLANSLTGQARTDDMNEGARRSHLERFVSTTYSSQYHLTWT